MCERFPFMKLAPDSLVLRTCSASTGFSLKAWPMFYLASMLIKFSANDLGLGSSCIFGFLG